MELPAKRSFESRASALIEQIEHVLLNYVTQRYLWVVAGFLALTTGPSLIALLVTGGPAASQRATGPALFLPVGMPMLMLMPFLVGQVKTQFGHARARLMPGFLPAHVIVVCGLLIALFLVYPIGMAILLRCPPLGMIALGLAIGVPAMWGAHLNRFGPMLISIVVFYSLLSTWGTNWWITNAAENVGPHVIVVGVGIVLIFAWLWRLCHLQEEASDYQNTHLVAISRRTGTEAVEQRRIVASQMQRHRLLAQINDRWHARLGGYFGGSPAGLSRVLRYGFSAIPVEVQGLFFTVLLISVGIFLNQVSYLAAGGTSIGMMFFAGQFAIMLPGQIAGEQIAQRRPRMASEMLLPLTREQYFNGLFAGAARNSITLWLMMHVALGVVLAVSNKQYSLGTVAMFLLLSAATMFVAMGVSLRTSVWPSLIKRLIATWVSLVGLAPSWVVWMTVREKTGDWPFVLMALALVGVGIWLVSLARKAWLDAEFV